LKYLLVILSSEEHDDTDKFCHDTLTNPELIDFLNQQQVLVWGGNVRYTEAFQVSNTLQATTYPFLAIIALHQPLNVSGSGSGSSSKMAVIERMEGPVTPANIMRRFESAISRTGPHLNHLRMEREQRELEHRLRQEQDSAYRASLKIDQEKERKAEQERQQAQLAEQQRIENKRNKKLYIKYLVQQFNEEEEQTETEKMTKISFRLANGDRVIRKFKATDSLERLYQFVEIYPFLQEQEQSVGIKELPTNKDYKHKFSFTIHSPFPRTVYQADSTILIQDEKSLWPSATLIVDTIDDEEEENEE
jgi:FAS-associated factor 2